jgi:pyruvate-formate lyase
LGANSVVLTADDKHELMVAMTKEERPVESLDRELAFTEAYRQAEGEHPYVREVRCLRVQVRGALLPMQGGDWFAGRLDRPLVGIDPERGDLIEAAYYIRAGFLEAQLERDDLPDGLRADIRALLDFWRERHTYAACRDAFPEHIQAGLPNDDYYSGRDAAYPMFGLGGPCLDYGKLLRIGVRGLRQEVQARMAAAARPAPGDAEARVFLQCLLDALDIFSDTALRYADDASRRADAATDPHLRARFALVADSARRIAHDPPASYHQALQLLWLYALVSLAKNYGRTDVLVGDLLARDLDSGRLTRDQALEITVGLWRLMNTRRNNNFNSRVVVGGLGRPNAANADRFALLAVEAQGIVREIMPQLSLRCCEGMDPKLRQAALDLMSTGYTFPLLYNDDVNVPAVQRAFGVSRQDAEQYYPYGCGEYVIDHKSIGSPDAALNVAKLLNVTLHNGVDPVSGERRGLALGKAADFGTFRELQSAFARQVEYHVGMLADAQDTIYRVTGRQAAFPFLSLLYDDCIARAKPLLAGGVRWRGGTLESFGNNTAADSLTAVKRLVYDEGAVDVQTLVAALDADFEGYEDVRRRIRAAPKYGNDDAEPDDMSLWVHRVVCESCSRQRLYTGLDTFLAVMINNGDSITLGKGTAATADGRRAGEPLSNGNQPSAGADINGATALLNSMAKLDPGTHAGAVHNLKLSRRTFSERRPEVDALIRGYFRRGGTQLMVTVTDRDELESALERPEQYRHVIVRVGGYCERFVDLPRDIQLEVIRRTLY